MKLNIKKATQIKIAAIALLFLTGLFGLAYGLKQVALWVNYHEFVFPERLVVFELKVNKPFEIKEREMQAPIFMVEAKYEDLDEAIKSTGDKQDVAKYICDKWGVTNCRTAIAVAKAESGLREEAININDNNTIDVGTFQINSVHFSKEGCSLKEVSTWKGNVDCAYQIYESHGKSFNPWVAYWKGSYLAQM